jgi:hypothetical protein
MDIGLSSLGEVSAIHAVAAGQDALDRPMSFDVELTLAVARDDAWVLGAMQRGHDAPGGAPLVRRVSGGGLVRVGPGTVHVLVTLARTTALYAVDAARLMNRYVRPLLDALTRSGAPAAYFGRDWISVKHRPAAAVGFAHDAGTGRAAFEAFVATRTPLSIPRASFLGKAPGTLEELAGRRIDAERLARAVPDAYARVSGGALHEMTARPVGQAKASEGELRDELPWAACVEEAIGPVCAGRDGSGVLRLGGDLMASRDAVARLEASVASLGPIATREQIGDLVTEAFAAEGATLFGVKDPGSVRDALFAALTPAAGSPSSPRARP